MNDNNAGGFAFGQAQPGLGNLAQDQQQAGLGTGPGAVDHEPTPSGEHGGISALSNPAGQAPLFGAGNANAQFEPLTEEMSQSIPALDFNGFVLHAASKPVPEELQRDPSGASIAEPDAVLDEENGRTYHNYHEGRYYLPNDAVCGWWLGNSVAARVLWNSALTTFAGRARPPRPAAQIVASSPGRCPFQGTHTVAAQKCPGRRHRHRHLGHTNGKDVP